jgi:DNA repair protein RadA/Sms
MIGHVNKEGFLAGPKVLEHMVDAVLQLEGDPDRGYRLLRAQKNRFGATQEIGVFEMTEGGMQELAVVPSRIPGAQQKSDSEIALFGVETLQELKTLLFH